MNFSTPEECERIARERINALFGKRTPVMFEAGWAPEFPNGLYVVKAKTPFADWAVMAGADRDLTAAPVRAWNRLVSMIPAPARIPCKHCKT